MASQGSTTAVADLEIRDRRDDLDDMRLGVDIANQASPPDWRTTVEELKSWESLREPGDLNLRLLAFRDGLGVGIGRASYSPGQVKGRFEVTVAVRPASQRQGIGGSLYRRLEDWAAGNGAREIECELRVTQLPPIESWLKREGFEEVSRMRESELVLDELPPNLEQEAREKAQRAGITLTTFEAEDTVENRRRLWRLSTVTGRDIPFDTEHGERPFESFDQFISAPMCLRPALVIAKDGDEYVGFSILGKRNEDVAVTWSTGVHPDYRGRGVARAVKTYSAALARKMGFKAMRTFNHVNNPAMLAVNVGMGYKPQPEVAFFVKKLP